MYGKQFRFIISAAVLLLSGCMTSGSQSGPSASMPENYSLPTVEQARPEVREGTIYVEKTAMDLYRDTRARTIGDILMVKIVETSSGSKKASTKTERASTVTGGVTALFGVEKWLAENNKFYDPSATSLQAGLTNDFEGTGETKRNSTVTATLSARVVDLTIDGNLVIRGFREVRVNNETQHIILSGIVRPADISQDNSILSSYISDARIEYGGTGVIADKQQPGWLAGLLEVVWPF
ncbi:MAG: flagellar basal body L-ring protein FlgH [Proteobacteria bacterium]|nr:flagellar basal body L-ring protein FlgH [Pseudomonadota bacterium]MBU1716477.1 flagellar basal body L-ring protein FlgH [Pseudomonadota bacterium]